MFVSTLHTLKSQAGATEEGGDPVLGVSEVALSAVVDGMDCVRPGKVRVCAGRKERSPEGGVGFHG